MKYEIAEGHSAIELETEVKKYLEAGWEPQGGIAVIVESIQDSRIPGYRTISSAIYYQAVVKHDPPFPVTTAFEEQKLKESLRKYVGDEFVNAVSTIRVEP